MERRLFFLHVLILLLLCPAYQLNAQNDTSNAQYRSEEQNDSIIEKLSGEGRKLAMDGDFDKAIETFQTILEDHDSTYHRALNNIGRVYKMLGRYNEALSLYQQAADIVIKECGDDCPELSIYYNNIGNIYNGKQDFELALQYYNYTERVIQVNSITNNQASTVYTNIGNAHYNMGEYRKALDSYLKSVDIKKTLNHGGLDISYANCASAYESLEKFDSAKVYYKRAIKQKIDKYGQDSYQLISVYNNYSLLLKNMDEYEKAFEYLSKALHLAINKYGKNHPYISESHQSLGEWYMSMKNPDSAIVHYHHAVIESVYDFDNPDFRVNPSLSEEIVSESSLLDALNGKAIAFKALYTQGGDVDNLIYSLETLDVFNLLTEKMRSSYFGQESKLLIVETSHMGLSRAINTAYMLYTITEDPKYARRAFIYAEKSKSSVLLATLQEVENKKNLIPTSIQTMEEDIKSEREILIKKLYEERQREGSDSAKLGRWQGKLINLNQQLDSINILIRNNYPEYAKKFDNDVVTVADVKEGLKPGQALVEYSFTDSTLFIFLLADDIEYFTRVEITEKFNNDISLLGQFLRNNDFANNTMDDYLAYTDAAYSLYGLLMKPLEEMISGRKLIIIPDGELGYIPFEALLSAEADQERMDYRSLPYLIYNYMTNYSYSATLHFNTKQREEKPGRQLLAFAPSYENVDDITAEKFPAFRNYSNVLVPLRFISQEIENISEIMESDKYMGFEATEQTFRKLAPEYDILHLAMHTLINEENPMYSQLVFSLNNDTTENNDGLLNTYELINMDLSARMAVLSACNTGYGQLRQGEGVMSLARGFISAGVPSIIMTLWAVEDQSGSILMSNFYKNLVDGLEIDVALRESKLEYLGNADQLGAHPYLWSGYVSIGATDPLAEGGTALWKYLLYAGLFLALITTIIILIRRKKKA